MRTYRRFVFALLAVIAAALFTGGCGRRGRNQNTSIPANPRYISDASRLSLGGHYLRRTSSEGEVRYYIPYSRDMSKGSPVTLWYHADWGAVPTLYAGDALVFKTDMALPDVFRFTRYRYEGYTFGFCGARQDKAGRFFINTAKLDRISDESSASKLARLNRSVTVLHAVNGNDKLQEGNFTPGGSVADLEKDASYDCVFYTGSIRYDIGLVADTVALSAWENVNAYKCEYADDDVVVIELPAGLQSGYYTCNGSGLFRYVDGREFSESTDFNVPNAEGLLAAAARKAGATQMESTPEDHTRTYKFTVTANTPTYIKVTYSDSETVTDPPVVRIVGEDSVRTISKTEGENLFEATLDLPLGSYRIEIDGLYDRQASVMYK